jgi:proteasome assembly chaperone (PAC2) family protein
VGGLLPALELLGLEPEGDLLLGGLDGVGAVADVAADVLVRERKSVGLSML